VGERVVVYLLYNRVNGKVYIGKSEVSAEKRWREHLCYARKGSKDPIHCAIRKYGPEAFEQILLSSHAESKEQLDDMERFFIAKFQSYPPSLGFGYNCTAGGEGMLGWHHTEKTRKQLSKSHKGVPTGRSWWKGKTLPKEITQKMSKTRKKKWDPATPGYQEFRDAQAERSRKQLLRQWKENPNWNKKRKQS
jgi:group I intron endonuclease